MTIKYADGWDLMPFSDLRNISNFEVLIKIEQGSVFTARLMDRMLPHSGNASHCKNRRRKPFSS